MARLVELVEVSAQVADVRARLAKISLLADFLATLPGGERGAAAAMLAGELPSGPTGAGPALLRRVAETPPATVPTLTVAGLVRRLAGIAEISGTGSQTRRGRSLGALFAESTRVEQHFLARLLLGELRQGASASLVLEAIARATSIPAAAVRRAAMLCGDLGRVAETAFAEGAAGLAAIGLRLFHPIQPMLAQPAADLDDALDRIADPILEIKLDGARVQVHKRGDRVRVFSRQGNEVTAAVPEIVELIAPLPDADLVLDGEILALAPDNAPLPFQTTMRRFGRRTAVARLREEIPLTPLFFDCIQRAGTLLIDTPAAERFAALADALPSTSLVPRLHTRNAGEAETFLTQTLEAGHEGLMAKSADSAYLAGGRGAQWLKIKQTRELDLVVLAAEWGSGRRSRWLSNLHLGARGSDGGFVMLGKTFKGLTDALLEWQTAEILAREIARDGPVVHCRPELVVEIAFNELQESPHYPGGLALRFARVRRYRPDKSADQADTIERVREIFAEQVAYRDRGGRV